ncbi:MAG: hypothetical protein NVSMB40_12450 [Aquirhabdus sp.]
MIATIVERLAGYPIAVVNGTKVIHEAQRDSHRKIRHLIWHLLSIVNYFMSKSYWQLKLLRLLSNAHKD